MLARKLNISCLAEGVETREQMEFLIESGCDELQGFYFGRPVPLNAALQLIHAAALAPLNATAQSAVAA